MKDLFVCALVAAFGPALSAGAVTVSGPGVASDVSELGVLSFDLDLTELGPIPLTATLEDGDTSPLVFTAVVWNFIEGSPELAGFELALTDGATFEVVGDATDGFGTFFTTAASGAAGASIDFSADPFATTIAFEIGDPLGFSDPSTGTTNWEISLAGVTGETFGLELRPTPLPEPPPTAILPLAALLAALRDAARRRRR